MNISRLIIILFSPALSIGSRIWLVESLAHIDVRQLAVLASTHEHTHTHRAMLVLGHMSRRVHSEFHRLEVRNIFTLLRKQNIFNFKDDSAGGVSK